MSIKGLGRGGLISEICSILSDIRCSCGVSDVKYASIVRTANMHIELFLILFDKKKRITLIS